MGNYRVILGEYLGNPGNIRRILGEYLEYKCRAVGDDIALLYSYVIDDVVR